jgi:anaerobic magnesium-protoporphyrin IX monomethyl ester cyclase
VLIVDMIRDLVVFKGDVNASLDKLAREIKQFRPDIIGFGFFSIHYFEVKRAVEVARKACDEVGLKPMFIAGGIHASTEPHSTICELGFDYSFVGEADLGIVRLADGVRPEAVAGVVGPATTQHRKGDQAEPLDSLRFPDWSLCDYGFYAFPSFAKTKFQASRSLDMIMGRGCVYKCAFCAYNALSTVRFYSAEYLADQMEYMRRSFGIDAVYYTDSTIGNNRRLIHELCELLIKRGTAEHMQWYANIRPNQVTEEELKLMWRAGCRFLFYGFESGSQRVLDLMVKGIKLEANYKAAELHNKLRFPYHASMLLGYPGEREEDIMETFAFLEAVKPPIVGINWYVPLPGSPDYDKLKAEGVIKTDDPMEWRRIGEVNSCRVYADVPEQRFRELYAQAEKIAYQDMPKRTHAAWGCLAPPQSEAAGHEHRDGQVADTSTQRSRATFGRVIHRLLQTVHIAN